MTLATYVNYALPVIVLLIGAGTLLANTALRQRRTRSKDSVKSDADQGASTQKARTEATIEYPNFRKAS